jgi:hypothetical protein
MRVYLFGFASDVLDPAATIAEAGLGNGDIFKVERSR